MNLIHHPEVADDIATAVLWYRDIGETLAEEFRSELKTALERIEQFPNRCHFDNSVGAVLNLKRFPYHIRFQLEDDTIYLMAIRHHRQNPSFGLDRDTD